MAENGMTNFAVSTGQLGAAIRSLAKSSITATDAARIWLDVLEVFFPNDQGFERVEVYSTRDRVLIEVQRDRDLDGDVIVDNDAKKPFLVVDCRPRATVDSGIGFSSSEGGNRGDFSVNFGLISFGAKAVFLKDVVSSQVMSLRGVRMSSANLVKAAGRDKTEEWLRAVRNICNELSRT